MRKSSSSSDSSDDDDDYPISKIQFKINPTAQKASTIVEESDETKISNAMRLVDKNIGHFATYSRSTRAVSRIFVLFIVKSIFSFRHAGRGNRCFFVEPSFFRTVRLETFGHEQIDFQRPNSAAVAFATDFVSRTLDEMFFDLFPFSSSRRTLSTSITADSFADGRKSLSIDDDNEVANTTNNARPIRTRQSMVRRATFSRLESNVDVRFQQPTMSSAAPSIANGRMTPFVGPTSQSFANGLSNSIEQRCSPLTIGATDQIPIAVAFQETIHVMMAGDDPSKSAQRIFLFHRIFSVRSGGKFAFSAICWSRFRQRFSIYSSILRLISIRSNFV